MEASEASAVASWSYSCDDGEHVRAMVRRDDERADQLRALGAEVVVGDLTHAGDIAVAMQGASRMFFNMSVSADYLLATAEVCAVALERGRLDAIVNMSQMTVSQMTLTSTEESHHQRLHWLAEHVLNWSGLPVIHVRPTVFLDNPLFTMLAAPTIRDRGVLALPFGTGRTSPIAAADVARVVAALLRDPADHIGNVYELTGPEVLDIDGLAEQYSRGLGRPVAGEDVPSTSGSARCSHRSACRSTSSSTSPPWRGYIAKTATTAPPTTSSGSPDSLPKPLSSTWRRIPICSTDRVDRTSFDRLFDMTGRTVIVTGGTRGIGLALAEGFVLAGANVVVASRKPDACEQAAEHLRGLGGAAIGVPTHSGNVDDLGALVQRTVDEFGGIDVVVNNAANALAQPLGEMTPEAWAKSYEVNLRGPVFLVQHALPHLKAELARGGAEHGVGRCVQLLADAVDVRLGQGGADVVNPVDGRRVRAVRHPGQRAGAGTGRHRHDAQQSAGSDRLHGRGDADEAAGLARRNGRRRTAVDVGRRQLHHRAGHHR